MNIDDYKQSLLSLLAEAYGLSNARTGFFLDRGDAGLFGQMSKIDAAAASARAAEGHETIASHCQHLLYTFEFFLAIEQGQQMQPDWASSWFPDTVNSAEWQKLQSDLRAAYDTTIGTLQARTEWPQQAVGAGMMLLAHTVYHVGVIDKMMTMLEK